MLGFTLPDQQTATEVLAEETMVQLSVFYVLGGTQEGDHVRTAKVHVMVHILGLGLQRLALHVFDNDGNEMISPYKCSLTEFDELVSVDEVAV